MFIVPEGAVNAGANLSEFWVFNLCLKLNETGGRFAFWAGGQFFGCCLGFCLLDGLLLLNFWGVFFLKQRIFLTIRFSHMQHTWTAWTEPGLKRHWKNTWFTYFYAHRLNWALVLLTCTADISHCTTVFSCFLSRETLLIKQHQKPT